MEIVFVGTGVSTAIPLMGHFGDCACRDALNTPNSKNKRNNVSLLISYRPRSAQTTEGDDRTCARSAAEDVNVLIDCGKTFRQAYFEQLVGRGLRRVDALLLTHDHADAVQGLDDLRDLQKFEQAEPYYVCKQYVPTFLTKTTLKTLSSQVGYIIRNSRYFGNAPASQQNHDVAWHAVDSKIPEDQRVIERRSTALDLWELSESEPHLFFVPGLGSDFPMYSVPVEHGKGYISLGFVFGRGTQLRQDGADSSAAVARNSGDCVAYISDVSHVPDATMRFLKRLVKIDLLVVDMLLGPDTPHFSHFCWDDAWALARELQPTRVLAVGMYCDLEHHESNRKLAAQLAEEHAAGCCLGIQSFQLAYDGLVLPLH